MKRFLFLITTICSVIVTNAQVGIGTTNPEGALDVVAVDQGIVVPRVSAVENVTTPDGNPAIDGTIVYDLSRQQMCRRIAGAWACSSATGNTSTIITEVYDNISNYIKASNTDAGDFFGAFIDLSADGNTLVVSAIAEDSNATGVNGDQTDNSASNSGAVYVYTRSGAIWSFDSYLKASNTETNDQFGSAVSISSDGTLIAIGAISESSNATGINGDETDNSAVSSGAVYIFTKSGGIWSQEAYIKASNTGAGDRFGEKISLSDDGIRLIVGTTYEDSNATGINGNESNNSIGNSGAVYVFLRTSGVWSQEAYIKASNTDLNDFFGNSLSINSDGSIIVVGARFEDSAATGVNGNPFDDAASSAGAAYVFRRSGNTWSQDAYLKASNTEAGDTFGTAVHTNGEGTTIAVSAIGEDANATGVGGDQLNNDFNNAGAVYIFSNNGATWSQSAYIKASNTSVADTFGTRIAFSQDGTVLLVYAESEDSSATGINGNEIDNTASFSGAVYSFIKLGNDWAQSAYIKASNTEAQDRFGSSLALNIDGSIATIGAFTEDSNATGIGGDQTDNSAANAGAVYIVE